MRANAVMLTIIGMLLLVGIAGAAIPDTATITSNKNWIVANNVDQSIITVEVRNTTFGPVQGAIVSFGTNDTQNKLGTLSSAGGTTGPSGTVSTTFKAKTTSGAVLITATVTYTGSDGSYTETLPLTQNIDHEVPVNVILHYPLEGEVASEVSFNISVFDRWGNPIDGRNMNETHSVSLRIDGPANDCGFKVGSLYPQTLSSNLDINGNLSLQVRLSNKTGDHNIQIASPFKMALIKGVATGDPYALTGSFSRVCLHSCPSEPNAAKANNEDYFILEYTLLDIYENPIRNRSISVYTNLSDELSPIPYTSNSLGQIQIKYGPKISIFDVKITANSTDIQSIGKELIVKFVNSGDPSNFILVITPETMASRDTDPAKTTQQATIVGRITDQWGNPVTDKEVSFNISYTPLELYETDPGPSFESGYQKLDKKSKTDVNGNAIITFYPGSFVNEGDVSYDDSATGRCWISATSVGLPTPDPINVEWKNFPYLSVTVNASPQTVRVNDTIDVTIKITGDGYKMVKVPITVVLDMDASSSLSATNGEDGYPRDLGAKTAAKHFVDNMSEEDRVGLVSYGNWSNNILWQQVANVTLTNHALLNSSIDALDLKGGVSGSGISMRESVEAAVYNITNNDLGWHDGDVGAIITIGDSSYLAGDFDIMVQQAKANKIRIYSILYVSSVKNSCDIKNGYAKDLNELTNATGGKFYCNSTLASVEAAMDDIKEDLSKIAGVNTQMDLNFEKVNVNSTPMDGKDVFSYVPVNVGLPGEYINHTKGNIDSAARTSIIWTDGNQSAINQTEEWEQNQHLNFTIGTIRIKETWETTFRFKINQTGTIQLFGPGSTISYNDIDGNLKLPNTTILSISNITPQHLGTGAVDISDLQTTSSTSIDSIPFQWKLTYTGNFTATETIFYSYNNGPWALFDTRTNGIVDHVVHYDQLNTQGITNGTYRIKVHVDTPDAGSDEMIIGTPPIGSKSPNLLLK